MFCHTFEMPKWLMTWYLPGEVHTFNLFSRN